MDGGELADPIQLNSIYADLAREKRCPQVIGVGSLLAGDLHL
jgi:hypothetical protein